MEGGKVRARARGSGGGVGRDVVFDCTGKGLVGWLFGGEERGGGERGERYFRR